MSNERKSEDAEAMKLPRHRASAKSISGGAAGTVGTVAIALAAGAITTAGVTSALASNNTSVRHDPIELANNVIEQDSSLTPVIASATDTDALAGFTSQLKVAGTAQHHRMAAELASRQPTVVLPAVGIITSGFGPRWGSFHGGIDIANAAGTPIHAIADGVVIDSGPAAGYGNWIRIRHNNGAISVYGHMYDLFVSKGEKVKAGQKIAGMGSAGFSTGTHLHFEIWPDGARKVDPLRWLARFGLHF